MRTTTPSTEAAGMVGPMMGLLTQAQLLPPAVSVTPKEKLLVVLVVVAGLKMGKKLAAEPSENPQLMASGCELVERTWGVPALSVAVTLMLYRPVGVLS